MIVNQVIVSVDIFNVFILPEAILFHEYCQH
uniref:Uncharacterized protein n=1 Tax=Tetranychus urticae TaxID=32264 RepID=T1JVH1_TETUR